MTLIADYPTYSQAREHLKDVLDATAHGQMVTVARGKEISAVLPAEQLRNYFFHTVSPKVRLMSEGDHVIALMDDRPFVSEGADTKGALADLLVSLREYAEDWDARLKSAPNHAHAWALVQLTKLSTDEELLDWFENGGE